MCFKQYILQWIKKKKSRIHKAVTVFSLFFLLWEGTKRDRDNRVLSISLCCFLCFAKEEKRSVFSLNKRLCFPGVGRILWLLCPWLILLFQGTRIFFYPFKLWLSWKTQRSKKISKYIWQKNHAEKSLFWLITSWSGDKFFKKKENRIEIGKFKFKSTMCCSKKKNRKKGGKKERKKKRKI